MLQCHDEWVLPNDASIQTLEKGVKWTKSENQVLHLPRSSTKNLYLMWQSQLNVLPSLHWVLSLNVRVKQDFPRSFAHCNHRKERCPKYGFHWPRYPGNSWKTSDVQCCKHNACIATWKGRQYLSNTEEYFERHRTCNSQPYTPRTST